MFNTSCTLSQVTVSWWRVQAVGAAKQNAHLPVTVLANGMTKLGAEDDLGDQVKLVRHERVNEVLKPCSGRFHWVEHVMWMDHQWVSEQALNFLVREKIRSTKNKLERHCRQSFAEDVTRLGNSSGSNWVCCKMWSTVYVITSTVKYWQLFHCCQHYVYLVMVVYLFTINFMLHHVM